MLKGGGVQCGMSLSLLVVGCSVYQYIIFSYVAGCGALNLVSYLDNHLHHSGSLDNPLRAGRLTTRPW